MTGFPAAGLTRLNPGNTAGWNPGYLLAGDWHPGRPPASGIIPFDYFSGIMHNIPVKKFDGILIDAVKESKEWAARCSVDFDEAVRFFEYAENLGIPTERHTAVNEGKEEIYERIPSKLRSSSF